MILDVEKKSRARYKTDKNSSEKYRHLLSVTLSLNNIPLSDAVEATQFSNPAVIFPVIFGLAQLCEGDSQPFGASSTGCFTEIYGLVAHPQRQFITIPMKIAEYLGYTRMLNRFA